MFDINNEITNCIRKYYINVQLFISVIEPKSL